MAKGLARLGVVLVVYVFSALAGAVLAGLAAGGGIVSTLLAAGAGMLLSSVALTAGLLGWMIPATIRIYASGGNPDTDYAVPKRPDAILFVAVSVLVASSVASWLQLPIFGFAGLVVVATSIIVSVGGARVAELWGNAVGAGLELLAG